MLGEAAAAHHPHHGGGSSGVSRNNREKSPSTCSSASGGVTAGTEWRSFCREEGKKVAIEFLERLRVYKETHAAASDIANSHCVREFATSLTELLAATATGSETGIAVSPPSKIKSGSSGKSWWRIFKRGKSLHRRDSTRKGPGSPLDNDPGILLDGILSQMNLQNAKETPHWERCRLVLIDRHGNHQLEVYTPPKSTTPKMSLFCFLIEEVRSTSYLEVPDSTTSFVIKSRSHGEYVFNTDSSNDKDIWINTISQYSTSHLPLSASLSALSESLRPNGRHFSRSRSHTPITSALTLSTADNPRVRESISPQTQVPPPSREPVMVDILLLGRDQQVPIRKNPPEPGRRLVKSLCVDTPSLLLPDSSSSPLDSESPPTLNHIEDQETHGAESSAKLTPPTKDSSLGSNVSNSSAPHLSVLAAADSGIVTTPPSPPPPVPRHRKSSAPSAVLHDLHDEGGAATPLFSSSEALGRVDSEELSFSGEGSTSNGRGHSRRRSYDSNYSRSTDIGGPTSPLARNCYRIDVGSNERISNVTSGRSSAFSSAGNLHDITRDVTRSPLTVPTTPDPLLSLETSSQLSNPLYIETTSHIDIQLPSHTEHPYQSWATTSVDVANLRTLSQFPWFHGMISRSNATQLVLDGAVSGRYLVRQSESREGDFVLTFNCQNRAKHLRLTLDETGCNIQHLWFEDVATMIDYFKTHPIPLDATPAAEDITLTSYVDRSASDSFRTTTVINMERINRTPPRRSRSIHVSSSLGTSLEGGANSPIHGSRGGSRQGNWRQIFNRQRSSSSQSVRSHATVQRTHSANAGSLQEIRLRGGGRWLAAGRSNENNYVSRNY